MTYELYRYIFIGGAVLAGIMLVVSVVLFFVLNIPHVLGDLTGANARKAIENIRNHNEGTGEKVYKSSYVNRERGKITDKISASGRLLKQSTSQTGGAMATEKIGTPQLVQAEETTVLNSDETTVLDGGAGETTVLSSAVGETTVLAVEVPPVMFQIEYEITYLHTNEVIA